MSRFSIILPVRNGGEYVKECVGSILAQSYADFKLIVLDNCSSDGTSEWLASIGDERVLVNRSDVSLSIEDNWARIVTTQKGEYMTMIGHDDLLEENYLSVMDALIMKHPDATLYQTHFRYIGTKGEPIRSCKPMDETQSAEEFLSFFLCSMIDVMGTGFMMRSADYDRIGGIPPRYPNLLFADFELLIKLCSIRYKATAFEECFSFRLHQSMTTTSSDIKFHAAYEVFIGYLVELNKDAGFKTVIDRYALDFLQYYTKGLAHRLIRTPKSKRKGKSVDELLTQAKRYADRLVPGNNFNPGRAPAVRFARLIDNNILFRNLFLFFKRMYSKPVL